MTGSWGTYRRGQRWRRSPRAAWLVLRHGDGEVVQFNGPVLELMTEARTRFDQRIAGLGPDIIKDDFDEDEFLRRLRNDDPTRPIGDALLDQRTIAGIGNLWKVEACFLAQVDPWRPTGTVSDDEALRIVREARPRMQRSASDGNQTRFKAIYGKTHLPCPRCGGRIRVRGQWDDNRPTFWCEGCQR
jgi:endonuclease-8